MTSWISSTLRHLITDPSVLGALAWIGLAVSVLGFGIAIQQIMKTRDAADAATIASQNLVRLVRGRELLMELASTMAFVDRASDAMGSGSYQMSSVYLELASTSMANVIELISDEDPDSRDLKRVRVRMNKLAESVQMTPVDEQEGKSMGLALQLRDLSTTLKAPAARLRYQFELKD